jgi:hypothetical protein
MVHELQIDIITVEYLLQPQQTLMIGEVFNMIIFGELLEVKLIDNDHVL